MNSEFHIKNLKLLNFQRNIFITLTFLLAISQLVISFFLFWKSEKTIVVPAIIEKEFWIDSNGYSSSYLEQMGYFLAKLVLEKSPQSAQTQRNIILRHVDPSYISLLNNKLIEEEKMLTEQDASYVFYPHYVQVDPTGLKVLITGDRVLFMGGKAMSTIKESYILSFLGKGSRLLLKEIISSDE